MHHVQPADDPFSGWILCPIYIYRVSVPITTNVESSNLVHARCTRQHYGIKFVRDLRQVGGYLEGLYFWRK
jgi:hypothetical protein